MTKEEVISLCSEWQHALHLDHWKIDISLIRLRDMNGHKSGSCNFTQRILEASIRILDPIDFPPGPLSQDIEQTIVHELLHIWFAPVTPAEDEEEYREIMFEQAIDTVARTLVEVKRRGKAGELQPNIE